MTADNPNPADIDWERARTAMALHQFQERYLPELRYALVGERLALDNHETVAIVRAAIAKICDRDHFAIPNELLDPLVSNFIIALSHESQERGDDKL